ncbi:MAG TPA: hypothetical protein VFN10_13255 [Thermoanaerobaculia bacterium]|nr:hypothetical protein [Thermoanaerobaculia bacterium]
MAHVLMVSTRMTSFVIGAVIILVAVCALMIVLLRMRRQVGGGWGPTEFSDGHMTTTPTGYPEEMKGNAKTIGPTDNAGG